MFLFCAASTALALVPFLAGTHEVIRRKPFRFHIRHVLMDRRLALFYVCTALHGFWEPAVFLFLSYTLKQRHAPDGLIGMIQGMNSLVAMISFPIAGRFADRVGRRPMLLLMYFMTALRLLLYSIIQSSWAYFPVQLLHFGTYGIGEGVGSVYVSELADERDRAIALACFHMSHSLGAVGAGIVGGYLSSSQSIPVMYRVFAGIMLLAGLIFYAGWKLDRGDTVRQASADMTA
jgi:MFS family permease